MILVRVETSPEDIHGMHAAQGILTARGGMTSHAAVVARGMGKCCVAGCGDIKVDYASGKFAAKGGTVIKKGDMITLDGSTGEVMLGEVATVPPPADRRLRDPHGLGRQVPQDEGAHQRRHPARRQHRARVRRRGDRPVPHRAHVLRRRPASPPSGR